MTKRQDWLFEAGLAGKAYAVNSGRITGSLFRMTLQNPAGSGIKAIVPLLSAFSSVPNFMRIVHEPVSNLPTAVLNPFTCFAGGDQPPAKLVAKGDIGLDLTSSIGEQLAFGLNEDTRLALEDMPAMILTPGHTLGFSLTLTGAASEASFTAYWVEEAFIA